MIDEKEGLREVPQEPAPPRRGSEWPIIIAAALALALVVSVVYGFHERNASQSLADDMAAQRQDMTSALNQAHAQMDALAAKVNALSSPPPQSVSARPETAKRPATARRTRVVEDRRIKKLQDEVDAQQKQLDSTQQNLEQARTELADNLSSTKDELNGSIAKTHDELVELEKKGERNYYEFDLAKSKGFKHVGSLSLSLRKTNVKHDYFDLAMIVNDSTVDKKHVNLYEPVVVSSDNSRRLELVVNQIDKDHVHGYVSEPKYQETASATTGTADAAASTGSDASSSPANTDNSQQNSDSSSGKPSDLPHRPGPNL